MAMNEVRAAAVRKRVGVRAEAVRSERVGDESSGSEEESGR